MSPAPKSQLPTDQRRRLGDALCALVTTAELRQSPSHRVDLAVARWSREVPSPADVLTLVADARARAAGPRSEEILEQALHVGVAEVAARQVREALTDPLTGLATRARLEDEVQQMIAVAARTRAPLTAVMVDVDGLKRINDEQGHRAGDEALAEVGRAIREHIRRTDRAFRWGGDEFALFMPSTTAEDARLVVERIQRSCSVPTTVGVATHSGEGRDTDIKAWLHRADTELYRRRDVERAPRPRRLQLGRPQSRLGGLAALAIATVMASTVGWFAASTASHTLGGSDPVDPAPEVVRPHITSPAPVRGPAAGPAVVVVTQEAAPSPSAPALPSLPTLPTAPQVPVQLPDVPLPSVPPLPTPEPTSVVGGLLSDVGDLLDRLL